jgi:hypothetical protein
MLQFVVVIENEKPSISGLENNDRDAILGFSANLFS